MSTRWRQRLEILLEWNDVIWEEFKNSAPEMAALGRERFDRTGLVLIGTLRKNGYPRITPVEPLFADGHLYLGMMWQSKKAQDLLRDPRCTVHNTVSNRDGSEGEFKVYGRAVPILDPEQRERYCNAVYVKTGWRPTEPEFHLFSIDIESVGIVAFSDDDMITRVWTPD
mgnify:CR=1 FL=1